MKPRKKGGRSPFHMSAPKQRRPAGSPTKNQLRAAAEAHARAHVSTWQTLIGVADQTWPRVPKAALANSDGNFHVVAGLVQMYGQLSREEADQQVQAFFSEHIPPMPSVESMAAAAAAAVAAAKPVAVAEPAEETEEAAA
ncbi:hypothetical protein [Solimonas marina]|uniref:Uncharacterized protein n=1 Tax=Solimonas marina TaxID=2714601 RepID=A0A969WDP5_9GAMM|nr:hypothetical protein [Solimonas marina]NKF24160.1 hypothetical protein [Solimonas marina]